MVPAIPMAPVPIRGDISAAIINPGAGTVALRVTGEDRGDIVAIRHIMVGCRAAVGNSKILAGVAEQPPTRFGVIGLFVTCTLALRRFAGGNTRA